MDSDQCAPGSSLLIMRLTQFMFWLAGNILLKCVHEINFDPASLITSPFYLCNRFVRRRGLALSAQYLTLEVTLRIIHRDGREKLSVKHITKFWHE